MCLLGLFLFGKPKKKPVFFLGAFPILRQSHSRLYTFCRFLASSFRCWGHGRLSASGLEAEFTKARCATGFADGWKWELSETGCNQSSDPCWVSWVLIGRHFRISIEPFFEGCFREVKRSTMMADFRCEVSPFCPHCQ